MNEKTITKILFLVFFLSSCSFEVSDQPVTNTPLVPETEEPLPEQDEPAETLQQSEAQAPAEAPTSSDQPSTSTPMPPSTKEAASDQEEPLTAEEQSDPPSSGLYLSGQLYYTGFIGPRQQSLIRLDLSEGEGTNLFLPPENALLREVVVSPDGEQLLLAYSPPPEEGEVQFAYTDLYIMPADGSMEPSPVFQEDDSSAAYFHISWPEDDLLYFARFGPSVDDEGTITFINRIERLHISSGQRDVLVTDASWPRVSRDGTMLAYVTEDNAFLLAGADGSNPRPILKQETFSAVDAPLFSPDNSLICFSAVLPETASLLSIWDRLMGVRVAQAHNVPSDWWCIPLDGSGDPLRLTNLNAIGIYGDFDESGEHLALLTTEGVFMMNPDGSDLIQLSEGAAIGTIDWVP